MEIDKTKIDLAHLQSATALLSEFCPGLSATTLIKALERQAGVEKEEKYYTTTQVAKLLGVCRGTIAKARRRGALKATPIRAADKRVLWRYSRAALDEFLKAQ